MSTAGASHSFSGETTAVQQWFAENSWLITAVVAAFGWIQTWIIAIFMLKGPHDYGHVADRRYTGLAKRTLWPAILSGKAECNPKLVVGCAAMDQGISSQLERLEDAEPATPFTFITWIAQLVGTVWVIVQVCTVWSSQTNWPDDSESTQWNIQQLTQLFSVVTINRGTWSIAPLGSFVPGLRLAGLYTTTAIAATLEVVMLARAAIIAHDTYVFNDATTTFWDQRLNDLSKIFPLVVVALEATVLIYGIITALFRIEFLRPIRHGFLFTAFWLVFSPWVTIVLAVLSHFAGSGSI